MTVRSFASKIEKYLKHIAGTPCLAILGAYTPLDARQNAASPSDDGASPRDEENNVRTCESDATSQCTESASHDLPGGHSTGTGTVSTGVGTLRQRAAHLDAPVLRGFVSLVRHPEVQRAMTGLVVAIRASEFLEPMRQLL